MLSDLTQPLAGDIQVVSLVYLFSVLLRPLQATDAVILYLVSVLCGGTVALLNVSLMCMSGPGLYEVVTLEREQHALETFGGGEEGLTEN